MAAKDLITLNRAYFNLPGVSGADAVIGALITAASDAIAKFCRRDFVVKQYDELYNGTGDRRLLLREYPVQSVQSVRYRPVTVLRVTNELAGNVQARVSITSVGLTLVTVNNGVKTTDTSITFAGNPTLFAVANALSSLGNGWSAQFIGDAVNFGSWPSGDLYWPSSYGDGIGGQGVQSCPAGDFAELKMHTYELEGYQWDPRGWLLRAIPYTDPELLHPEDLVWPVGINNFRIQYTAGYNTIPESVQEACAEWVAILYNQMQRDPLVSLESLSGSTLKSESYQKLTGQPPDSVVLLLKPYRRHTLGTNQG